MTITLYINSSETNKLNKTLSDGVTLTGTLREESNVVNPSILIEYGDNIVSFNYCYIAEFKRYYFINEIESIRNNIWRLSLKTDVLMSFKSEISNCTGIIEDSTNFGNNYVSGDQWLATCKSYTDIINFENGFNDDGEYILITAGG